MINSNWKYLSFILVILMLTNMVSTSFADYENGNAFTEVKMG